MAELLTISLSIDKGYVQLFDITGRFFILPLEMMVKLRNSWKGKQFLSRKSVVFSYFAYVTEEKKESNMSVHKKREDRWLLVFTDLFGVIV